MAAIRALNVIYGASFIFDIPITSSVSSEGIMTAKANFDPWLLLTVAASTVYFHVFILTSLSKSETAQNFQELKLN